MTLNPRIQVESWQRSVYALAYQITQLCAEDSLLPESATARSEFFFSDEGVPLPRPCTALAWASLCAFGPIQGWKCVDEEKDEFYYHHFDPTRGNFLVPFLPKILSQDDQSQSLARVSKLHARDSEGHINWGQVYIGDSASGHITQQLPTGQAIAKEWADPKPTRIAILNIEEDCRVPALYSELDEGWQFGVIQNIPSMPVTLRDPMMVLAARGIIETKWTKIRQLYIKRLLMRFLKVESAQTWAAAYSKAMPAIAEPDSYQPDLDLLILEIKAHRANQVKRANEKDKTKKHKPISDSFLANFNKKLGE